MLESVILNYLGAFFFKAISFLHFEVKFKVFENKITASANEYDTGNCLDKLDSPSGLDEIFSVVFGVSNSTFFEENVFIPTIFGGCFGNCNYFVVFCIQLFEKKTFCRRDKMACAIIGMDYILDVLIIVKCKSAIVNFVRDLIISTALTACESTVAIAAPAIPILNTMINKRSSTILKILHTIRK